MFLFSRPSWVRRLVHGPCQSVVDDLYEMHERLEDQYERLEADHNALATAAYRTDEALSESAQAHDEAETALNEARDRIEVQDQELERMRGLVQALRAALSSSSEGAYQIEAARDEDDADLHQLVDRMFELMALRQGLEMLVEDPPPEMATDVIAGAHRLIGRAQERADLLGRAVT